MVAIKARNGRYLSINVDKEGVPDHWPEFDSTSTSGTSVATIQVKAINNIIMYNYGIFTEEFSEYYQV